MNHHLSAVLLALFLTPSTSFAEASNKIPTSDYTYGAKLDIARIVSMEEPDTRTCEVVEAKMTYVNSQGIVNAVTYKKLSEVCASSN
jgi:hypothetical protein